MAAPKKKKVRWLPAVEAHDFPAARSYLGLIYDRKKVNGMIARLKSAPVIQFKAKDIFRAARLPLLGGNNSHVEKDRARIQKGQGWPRSSSCATSRTASSSSRTATTGCAPSTRSTRMPSSAAGSSEDPGGA